MKKCYYVVDTFNKTRLPGYHTKLEIAQQRKAKFESMTRLGRFGIVPCKVSDMHSSLAEQNAMGIWPVSEFTQKALGKFDYGN